MKNSLRQLLYLLIFFVIAIASLYGMTIGVRLIEIENSFYYLIGAVVWGIIINYVNNKLGHILWVKILIIILAIPILLLLAIAFLVYSSWRIATPVFIVIMTFTFSYIISLGLFKVLDFFFDLGVNLEFYLTITLTSIFYTTKLKNLPLQFFLYGLRIKQSKVFKDGKVLKTIEYLLNDNSVRLGIYSCYLLFIGYTSFISLANNSENFYLIENAEAWRLSFITYIAFDRVYLYYNNPQVDFIDFNHLVKESLIPMKESVKKFFTSEEDKKDIPND